MNLSEYQPLAVSTAVPSALSRDYLVPMIVGEVGELFGKVAKARRDEWSTERLQADLVKEYGDIAWGTAVLLHTDGVSTAPDSWVADFPEFSLQTLLSQAGVLFDIHLKMPRYTRNEALYLWYLLEANCELVTMHSWHTVLQANVDKLASRAERGTIQGSGDNR
jgi:hypothetical protein